jgi:hypothetical protein
VKRVVQIICKYCGLKVHLSYVEARVHTRCSHCNQPEFEAHEITNSKVDYYAGSPPFPENDDTPWAMGNGMDDF